MAAAHGRPPNFTFGAAHLDRGLGRVQWDVRMRYSDDGIERVAVLSLIAEHIGSETSLRFWDADRLREVGTFLRHHTDSDQHAAAVANGKVWRLHRRTGLGRTTAHAAAAPTYCTSSQLLIHPSRTTMTDNELIGITTQISDSTMVKSIQLNITDVINSIFISVIKNLKIIAF